MSMQNEIEQSNGFLRENQKEIEDHKKISIQLKEASKLHLKAANYLEHGNHVQALSTTVNAYGMIGLVKEAQKIILDHSLNDIVVL